MSTKSNLLLSLGLIVFCCTNSQSIEGSVDSFDISSDDKKIIFSFYEEGESSIYSVDLDGKNVKSLFQSNGYISYTNPRYSSDGARILFIKFQKNDPLKNTLCIANVDGTKIENIVDGSGIITEAIFSNNGDEIIFCKAAEFEKHSPLGIKSAHNFDIYSVNILTRKITKLSNFDAYQISNISEVDPDYILFHVEAGDEGGMYLFEKKNQARIRKVAPINDPRNDESMYYDPVYDRKLDILIFTAPYELYSMSLNDRVAKLIYDSKGDSQITSVRLFNTEKKVLFKKEVERNVIQSLDLESGNIKAINIEINH